MKATITSIVKKWKDLPRDELTKNKEQLQYIKELASRTETNISKWNILPLFCSPETTNILEDRNDINKAFFAYLAEVKAKAAEEAPEKVAMTEELRTRLKQFSVNLRAESIMREKRAISAHTRELTRLQESMTNQQKAFIKAQQRLLDLEENESEDTRVERVIDGLNDVLAESNFYGDAIVENSAIWVRVMNDLVLTYSNPQADVSTTRNLGQFSVKIDLVEGTTLLVPYKKNLSAGNGFFHPHASAYGEICWGDAHDTSRTLLATWDIKPLLLLLQNLLLAYNPGNPYVDLHRFSEGSKLNMAQSYRSTRNPHTTRDKRLAAERKLEKEKVRLEKEKARTEKEAEEARKLNEIRVAKIMEATKLIASRLLTDQTQPSIEDAAVPRAASEQTTEI